MLKERGMTIIEFINHVFHHKLLRDALLNQHIVKFFISIKLFIGQSNWSVGVKVYALGKSIILKPTI